MWLLIMKGGNACFRNLLLERDRQGIEIRNVPRPQAGEGPPL